MLELILQDRIQYLLWILLFFSQRQNLVTYFFTQTFHWNYHECRVKIHESRRRKGCQEVSCKICWGFVNLTNIKRNKKVFVYSLKYGEVNGNTNPTFCFFKWKILLLFRYNFHCVDRQLNLIPLRVYSGKYFCNRPLKFPLIVEHC